MKILLSFLKNFANVHKTRKENNQLVINGIRSDIKVKSAKVIIILIWRKSCNQKS